MTALETFTTASKQPLTTGRRPDTTGICAFRPAGVDVKLPFEIAAVDVAVGIANSLRPVSSGAI